MVCKTTYDSLFVIYATFRRPAQKRGQKDSVCADEEEFKSDDDDSDDES
jgi:hypothetical protein